VEDLFARIGENIRRYRKNRGMTQEQLAEASELSAYFVGSIERGQATVSVRSLEQVARALHIQLRDLFVFAEEHVGREQLVQEIEECVRAAGIEELRALAAVCRMVRRPTALARG
jgi:transcriptional regulator with XRE-family HTH domain